MSPTSAKPDRNAGLFRPIPATAMSCNFTPKRGPWLNQAELFFSVVHRRFLARGSFSSAKDFERRLGALFESY